MHLAELIAKRQSESARRRRELELFDAETRGLIAALDLTGVAPAAAQPRAAPTMGMLIPSPTVKRGGRQPGAISSDWRAILRALFLDKPHGFTEEHVVPMAKLQGIEIKPKDAKDRMEKYKEHNYVESLNGLYKVTRHAAERFGFLHELAYPTVNDDLV